MKHRTSGLTAAAAGIAVIGIAVLGLNQTTTESPPRASGITSPAPPVGAIPPTEHRSQGLFGAEEANTHTLPNGSPNRMSADPPPGFEAEDFPYSGSQDSQEESLPEPVTIGEEAIPVKQHAVFETQAALRVKVMDGWRMEGNTPQNASMKNSELPCQYHVKRHDSFRPPADKPTLFGDIATTEGVLSGVQKGFGRDLSNVHYERGVKTVDIPQKTPSGPGLEFEMVRMDYQVSGFTTSVTTRMAARSMPHSNTVLLIVLTCPTSVAESKSNPWRELIENTFVVAYDEQQNTVTKPPRP